MTAQKVDLLVIGGGSGGVRCGRVAGQHGASVVLAERDALGGTCVNRGCVPKKFMVYAANYGRQQKLLQQGAYGWMAGESNFDWQRLCKDIDEELLRLNGMYGNTLEKNNVEVLHEQATFIDDKHVKIGERLYEPRHVLVSVGGTPRRPEIEGAEHVLVSDDIFKMKQLPSSMLVVGGGYIALEFVNVFEGLGLDTTLAYRGELFLRGFEECLRNALKEEMLARDMDVRFNTTPKRIIKHGEHDLEVVFDDDSKLRTGAVMYAIGRQPSTDGLGLENTGIKLNAQGQIEVDVGYTTSLPHIYAVGDVVGGMELTPVAIAQGEQLALRLFANGDGNIDLSNVPTAVFSYPELATVGLTEEEARALYPKAHVLQSKFTSLRNSLLRAHGTPQKSIIKVIATEEGESGKIVGAHMAGADAAEIIQIMALAIKSGAGMRELKRTIALHPTTAEEFVTFSGL